MASWPRSQIELTAREREMLQLTADGLEGPEIARKFWLSNETVKSHKRNIRVKLGARTTAQAVAIALRRGLIE